LQEVGAGGVALEVGVALAAVVVDLQDADVISLFDRDRDRGGAVGRRRQRGGGGLG
jgi:hypothetical protein